DLAVQQLVVCAPDNAKAAGAETFEQAVATVHKRAVAARHAIALRAVMARRTVPPRASVAPSAVAARRTVRALHVGLARRAGEDPGEPRLARRERMSFPETRLRWDVGAWKTIMDEGFERIHRVPRSPPAGALPARARRKKRIDREVA